MNNLEHWEQNSPKQYSEIRCKYYDKRIGEKKKNKKAADKADSRIN